MGTLNPSILTRSLVTNLETNIKLKYCPKSFNAELDFIWFESAESYRNSFIKLVSIKSRGTNRSGTFYSIPKSSMQFLKVIC